MNNVTIYVLRLVNAAYDFFIYPRMSVTNDCLEADIITECGCLYRDTIKTHQIKGIEKSYWNEMPRNVDGIVISHMHYHGIEKVRGGSFSKAVLSAEEKEYISDRIKFMFYDLEENATKTNEIHNFKNEFKNHPIENLQKTLNQLEDEITQMKLAHSNVLNYYPKATPEDVKQLKYFIKTACDPNRDWHFLKILSNYHDMMDRLRLTYEQYVKYVEDASTNLNKISNNLNNIYYKVPKLYFDSRVIESERAHLKDDNKNCDEQMFKAIELMIYTLINRSDEFKFDAGKGWKTHELKCEIIDEILKKNFQ
jgi:hypothetical protein